MMGIKEGNCKMVVIVEIDTFFINYSCMRTICQPDTSCSCMALICGAVNNNDMKSYIVSLIVEIDYFLINYS